MKILLTSILIFVNLFVYGQLVNGGMRMEYSLMKGNVPDARINYYSSILEQEPTNAKVLLIRSSLYESMSMDLEAKNDRHLALSINPYSPLYVSRSFRKELIPFRNYSFIDNIEESEPFPKSFLLANEYERVLDVSNISNNTRLLLETALNAIENGEYLSAEMNLEKIAEADRENALYYDILGVLSIEKEEYENAITLFSKAISIDEYFTIAYHNRAVAYKALGEYQAAEQNFKKAILQRADLAKIQFGKAKLFELQGDDVGAQSYYEAAIDLDNNYSEARLNYASLLKAGGEYTKAMIKINQAIADDPAHIENYYVRGGIHFIYGEYENAIRDFDAYLEVKYEDVDVLFFRGLSKVLGGNTIQGCNDMSDSISNGYDKHSDISLFMCN